jgi:FMN phosphatase YigB (HAD superfamily)
MRVPVVFLVDVDNTLLDNDAVAAALTRELDTAMGTTLRERYWKLFEDIRKEVGYADYIGALQRLRAEDPRNAGLLSVSGFLVNYPFAERLFPGALELIASWSRFGPVVIFSDGDIVFQPLKIERSGLLAAVERRVLVYTHKEHELDDVELRYPAEHYVLADDKVRILTSVKASWGDRVTTVFPVQGHYARAADVANFPTPDVTVGRIADLLSVDPPAGVTRAMPVAAGRPRGAKP